MRGLRNARRPAHMVCGITPAHAGLTTAASSRHRARWDHPRACGAYSESQKNGDFVQGSPPRMRGLLCFPLRGQYRAGITPAHAGLTWASSVSIRRTWDHPRACGAYTIVIDIGGIKTGSPPRMRGLPEPGGWQHISCRITPAHAGLT